jgi:hypothetical protein
LPEIRYHPVSTWGCTLRKRHTEDGQEGHNYVNRGRRQGLDLDVTQNHDNVPLTFALGIAHWGQDEMPSVVDDRRCDLAHARAI